MINYPLGDLINKLVFVSLVYNVYPTSYYVTLGQRSLSKFVLL